MKSFFSQCFRRLGAISAIGAALLASCSFSGMAEPDYNAIGQQFSRVLQNGHISQRLFTQELNQKFLDCYLQTLDPQHLFITREDEKALQDLYGKTFGDYLLTGNTAGLAQELYGFYSARALQYIDFAETTLKNYQGKMPEFDSDRSVERTRRKTERAANADALRQVWRDQVENMLLTEQIRRDNMAKLAADKGKPDPNAKEKSIIEKVEARLKRRRTEVQEADLEDMVSDVLNAVAHVYDPHSDYMGAREEQRFKDMMAASLVGIGARLKADDDGSTTVEGIVKGGPAAKEGHLALGDHIVAVDRSADGNWTDIMYMSIDKVVDLIRGKKNVPVRLRVLSSSSGEVKEVTIARDEIPMSEEFASARIIDMKQGEKTYRLGLLALPSFYVDLDDESVHCAADVKQILRRMVKEKVQGIVIDLRFNGGGSLDEVRKMVGFFTGAGPVVQVRGSRGHVERLTVSGIPLFNGPLVVLCNKLSASASEIFAGAMADYGRAVIVGDDTTFGKGTVQVPRSLVHYLPVLSSREGCGMIKVTIQKFYRVGGASTQLKGVSSDIVLPSLTAGLRVGEGELDYAMPYDSIIQAPNYVKDGRLARILPDLSAASAKRVSADKDLQYVSEDVARAKDEQEKNRLSLNKKIREQENAKLLARKKSIDAERAERYAAMLKEDEKALTIYRLNLEDVKKTQLPLYTKEDNKSFMDEVNDPEDELTESPEYPSGIDPLLRESLHIVRDMVDVY